VPPRSPQAGRASKPMLSVHTQDLAQAPANFDSQHPLAARFPSPPTCTHHIAQPSPSGAIPRPPAMIITNRGVESYLSLADVRSFSNIFSRNSQLIVQSGAVGKAYEVKTLMTRNLSEFFAWYMIEADHIIAATSLILILFNSNGQTMRTFRIDRGAGTQFQLVKQAVWDTFWASFSNGESHSLQVYVSVPDESSSNIGDTTPNHRSLPFQTGRQSTGHESNIRDLLN
jgi:hypothetical protein